MHDSRRPYKNSNASTFDKIIKNIERNVELVQILINTVVDKNNISDLGNYFYFLQEKHLIDKVLINLTPMSNYVGQEFSNTNVLSTDDYHYLIEANELSLSYGAKLSRPFPFVSPCTYNNPNAFAIDSNGDIYKCPGMYGIKEVALGNVNSSSKLSPLDTSTIKSSCFGCQYLFFCGGTPQRYCSENRPGRETRRCCKDFFNEFIPNYIERVFIPWSEQQI